MAELQPISFRERFIIAVNGILEPGTRGPRHPMMTPPVEEKALVYKPLSPVAKVTDSGEVKYDRDLKLPPMAITAEIIAQHQAQNPRGTRSRQEYPFAIKAVGYVNAWDILYRQGQTTSDTFEMVP